MIVGALGFGAALLVSMYLASPEFEPTTTERTAVTLPHEPGHTTVLGPVPSDSVASRTEPGVALSPRLDDLANDQYATPPLNAEETKRLHAQQQADVERLLGDLDAVVLRTDNGNGTPITVRELLALHEQQERELVSTYDGEIAIPATDTSPALTVADLRALHEQQVQAVEATASTDEIVIVGAVSGTFDLTRNEIVALHERQRAESDRNIGLMNVYPAPLDTERGQALTVEQVRELHGSQSQE